MAIQKLMRVVRERVLDSTRRQGHSAQLVEVRDQLVDDVFLVPSPLEGAGGGPGGGPVAKRARTDGTESSS
jgi:hypothetical protein